MTRKDFIAIADALGRALNECGTRVDAETFVFDHIVGKLSDHFAKANPRFDETKFIERIEEVAFSHMHD